MIFENPGRPLQLLNVLFRQRFHAAKRKHISDRITRLAAIEIRVCDIRNCINNATTTLSSCSVTVRKSKSPEPVTV